MTKRTKGQSVDNGVKFSQGIILHLPIKPNSSFSNDNLSGFNSFDQSHKPNKEPVPFFLEDNYGTIGSSIKEKEDINSIASMTTMDNTFNNSNNIDNQSNTCPMVKETVFDWKSSTKTHCFWDCHPFDHAPCGIPHSFFDGMALQPCFCSFECALSYIQQDQSYGMWEKVSLLKNMYRKQFSNEAKLNCAPPRETLKIFGGPLTIEEFRKKNHNMNYFIIKRPLSTFKQTLQTMDKRRSGVSSQNSSHNKDDDLVLRREKPLFCKKGSLETTMGLRQIVD